MTAQLGWPKQSHFMTAWFGKIFRSIYRFASFRRVTSCKVWRFRIVHPLQIRAFRIRTVLQDSADLPRLALLLVLQAHGQPSAGKLTEMKREKGQKMDWAVKLALHSLVVSRCYLGSTYILRFVTFIFIIFESFSHLFQCCTVRNKLEISANRDQSSRASLSTMIWIAATKCVCCMHLYAILWSNDALLASNPPLSKCHRSVLVVRACALVHAFWCLLSST